MRRASRMQRGAAAALALLLWATSSAAQAQAPAARCDKAVYLTLDTGHMGVAEHIAQVLQRQGVRATFFAANEATQVGDGSLGAHWAPWWHARAQEGHQLASHTWDHIHWRGDAGTPQAPAFRVRASQGARKGQTWVMDAAAYCAQIDQAAQRLQAITGQAPLPVFRAPGGATSAQLLQVVQRCGYQHVGWSKAGFLGDELPSERYSNAQLLRQALGRIRAGDVLMAHLGIWSRKDPWAPAVLEPLIEGLKAQGFCFATLREHPLLGTGQPIGGGY